MSYVSVAVYNLYILSVSNFKAELWCSDNDRIWMQLKRESMRACDQRLKKLRNLFSFLSVSLSNCKSNEDILWLLLRYSKSVICEI